MSKHLFGVVLTPHGIAANNRGEGEGNLVTLQKILWNGEVHSTVSAEAIRWAMRWYWQQRHLAVNRKWHEENRQHTWEDHDFTQAGEAFIDDDVLGYMSAQAARQEAGSEPAAKGRVRGSVLVRRSPFETTRAISIDPWPGDVVFNVASIGATPSASTKGAFPVPYSAEVHATRYQYGFALTPESLMNRSRALNVVDAIVDLADVAGNHARFLFDFAPDTIIFRWTDDFAPRMLYPFVVDADGVVSIPVLLERVEAGDIDAGELIIGGSLATSPDGERLRRLGASVDPGVKKAAAAVKERLMKVIGASS